MCILADSYDVKNECNNEACEQVCVSNLGGAYVNFLEISRVLSEEQLIAHSQYFDYFFHSGPLCHSPNQLSLILIILIKS